MEATADVFQAAHLIGVQALRVGRRKLGRAWRVSRGVLLSNRRDMMGFSSCVSIVVGVSHIYGPAAWIVAGLMGLALLHLTTSPPVEH